MDIRFRIRSQNIGTTIMEINPSRINQFICDNVVSDDMRIDVSTLLFDQNNIEIFENDLVCDSSKNRYRIAYKKGAFVAIKENDSSGHAIPLYLLQINSHIPVEVITE